RCFGLILPPPGGGPYCATISGGAMIDFGRKKPMMVKGILSSSTQMYCGSLGTSPKRGFLIRSQRFSVALILMDASLLVRPRRSLTVEHPETPSVSTIRHARDHLIGGLR